jgi:hypothetical protein
MSVERRFGYYALMGMSELIVLGMLVLLLGWPNLEKMARTLWDNLAAKTFLFPLSLFGCGVLLLSRSRGFSPMLKDGRYALSCIGGAVASLALFLTLPLLFAKTQR